MGRSAAGLDGLPPDTSGEFLEGGVGSGFGVVGREGKEGGVVYWSVEPSEATFS